MSCKQVQRLLNLNRPGELNARERQELEQHLESCRSCSEELQRIQTIEARMESLRLDVPQVSDPQDLTERILAGIQDKSRAEAQPGIGAVVTALNWLFGPALPRRAAAAICFGMICLFLGQHLLMLREVRGLEQKLARTPYTAAALNLNYVIPRAAWEEFERDLGNGVARKALARFMQRKENQVYLAKRPLRRLMIRYRDRQLQRALVVSKILEQNPGLKEKLEPLLKRKAPRIRPWFKLQQHRRKQP